MGGQSIDGLVATNAKMNPKEERYYTEGQRSIWLRLLREAIVNLTDQIDGPMRTEARLVLQLEETRAALRTVCGDHGDNDWDDDLHLADVVEKHLGRHLTGRQFMEDTKS